MKFFRLWIFAGLLLLILACEENSTMPETVAPSLGTLKLSGWTVDSVDENSQRIHVSPSKERLDSIVIDSAEAIGGASLYLAADGDLYSPELGEMLSSKTVISTVDTTNFSIVVLDEKNRIVAVWLVCWEDDDETSSSSAEDNGELSSSSSSVIEIASSSSTTRGDSTISTSRGDNEAWQSSSSSSSRGDSEAKQSSSSSSRGDSEAKQSSSSTSRGDGAVWLSNLLPIVSGDTLKNAVTVSGENIRIDVPYALSLNNSLSHIQFVGIDSSYDLRSAKTLNLLSEDSLLTAYRVIAEVQLPGSDFSKREDSFWATTSDAMATEGTAKVVANYTFTSAANLLENGNSLTLASRIVSCAWAGITGGKKLATGIYFAGSYAGEDAMNIYDVSYDGGTPSTGTSDVTSQMTFGRPFYGRPKAFELTYSYEHVDGKNADYPQKGLAYVILVSKNSQAIAVGALTWEFSDANTSTVELSYGADPDGVLSAGYAGTSDLILGSGDEEVTSIRIVFASSAFAHVVAGGSSVLNDPSKDFRGGDGSSLTIENFKLVYE